MIVIAITITLMFIIISSTLIIMVIASFIILVSIIDRHGQALLRRRAGHGHLVYGDSAMISPTLISGNP